LIDFLVKMKPEIYQGILIRQLAPAPVTELKNAIRGAKKVIVAEYNARGQIRTLIKDALSEADVQSILRYDGEHYTIDEFEQAVQEVLDEKVINEI
jgi:2-oxoglutarate ferredoxin oxidoreductase subunit alpha